MNDKVAPSGSTIADRLAAETRRLKDSAPEFARAYENLVARLIRGGAGRNAPKTGDLLPSFILPDDDGRLVSLGDLVSAGPVVVSFNRGHWCNYCRIELQGLQEIYGEVQRRGGAIVAITPDRQAYARALRARCNLTFPLLSDMDNVFAMSLGLVVWCGDEIRTLYEDDDMDLSRFQGNDGWLIPIPATYVVGGDRRIRASLVNADFRERMSSEEILQAI